MIRSRLRVVKTERKLEENFENFMGNVFSFPKEKVNTVQSKQVISFSNSAFWHVHTLSPSFVSLSTLTNFQTVKLKKKIRTFQCLNKPPIA